MMEIVGQMGPSQSCTHRPCYKLAVPTLTPVSGKCVIGSLSRVLLLSTKNTHAPQAGKDTALPLSILHPFSDNDARTCDMSHT